jgi:ABC-2 type transport system ATP-binding protein
VVEILDLLRRLVQERGLAVLLSSHLLTQVQSVCDRVGIFANGRLVGQGTVDQLAAAYGEGVARIDVGLETPDPASSERAGTALTGLPNVESVEPPGAHGHAWRLTVRPASAEVAVREAVLATVVAAGLRLTELRPTVPSLDDIYRSALGRHGLAPHGEVGRPAA